MNPAESVGECRRPWERFWLLFLRLQKEYTGLLVAYIVEEGCFLENEQLQKGVIWGLGRLKTIDEALKDKVFPFLLRALKHSDPSMKGTAAWTLGELGAREAVPFLKTLQKEKQID